MSADWWPARRRPVWVRLMATFVLYRRPMFPVAWPSLSRNTVEAQAGEAALEAVGRAAAEAMGVEARAAVALAALRAAGQPAVARQADRAPTPPGARERDHH